MSRRRSQESLRGFVAAVAAAWSATLAAAAADQQQWPAVFRDITEVRVINVDVAVSDDRGLPVRGLNKDDFLLFVDGRPTEISNFLEVSNGQFQSDPRPTARDLDRGDERETSAIRPRHLVIYVDNARLTTPSRNRALRNLTRVFFPGLPAATRVMVASNDRELVVRQPFTVDTGKVLSALEDLESARTWGGWVTHQRRQLLGEMERASQAQEVTIMLLMNSMDADLDPTADLPDETTGLRSRLRLFNQERYDDLRYSVRVAHHLVDVVAGFPGRKEILYLTEGLTVRPGQDLIEGFARRFEGLPGSTSWTPPGLEATSFDLTRDLLGLVAHANASGVAFYAMDISTPAASDPDATLFASHFWSGEVSSLEDGNRMESLRLLADGTGGRAAYSIGAFESLLTRLRQDLESYYSLAYVADSTAEEGERRIKVTSPSEDLRVRHRASLREKTASTRLREKTLAALWTDHPENPLTLSLKTGDPRLQSDGNFLVPVLVTLPLEELILVPAKDQHLAQLSLFVAARDDQGRTSEVNEHRCSVRIPNSEMLLALGRDASCRVSLLMRSGRQRVAISARDDIAAVDSTASLVLELPLEIQPASLE